MCDGIPEEELLLLQIGWQERALELRRMRGEPADIAEFDEAEEEKFSREVEEIAAGHSNARHN